MTMRRYAGLRQCWLCQSHVCNWRPVRGIVHQHSKRRESSRRMERARVSVEICRVAGYSFNGMAKCRRVGEASGAGKGERVRRCAAQKPKRVVALSVKKGSSATPLSSLSHIIHAPPAPCHLGDGLLWLVQRAMGMRAVGVGREGVCRRVGARGVPRWQLGPGRV